MDKFGRNYRLFLQRNDKTDPDDFVNSYVQVELPFTIEFDIQRDTLSSANTASVTVMNLAEETRNLLELTVYDKDNYKRIVLFGGYGNVLSTIFRGDMNSVESYREGTTFMTRVEAFDGGYASRTSNFNYTFPKGTSLDQILKTLCVTLKDKNVDIGVISNIENNLITRGNSYAGNTLQLIRDLSGGSVFIDNEKINVLLDNGYIFTEPKDIPLFDFDTGLLSTPRRQQTYLHFDVIFEPRVQLGRLIQLQSLTNKNYNGFYKVVGVQHKGTISSAVSGDCITSIQVPYIRNAVAQRPEDVVL